MKEHGKMRKKRNRGGITNYISDDQHVIHHVAWYGISRGIWSACQCHNRNGL